MSEVDIADNSKPLEDVSLHNDQLSLEDTEKEELKDNPSKEIVTSSKMPEKKKSKKHFH